MSIADMNIQIKTGPRPTDYLTTTIVAAGAVVLLVAVSASVMYLITSFLFAFSGGQYRMVPVVGYGALAVIGATLLIAIVVWRLRSLAAAVKWAAIATALGWALAIGSESTLKATCRPCRFDITCSSGGPPGSLLKNTIAPPCSV